MIDDVTEEAEASALLPPAAPNEGLGWTSVATDIMMTYTSALDRSLVYTWGSELETCSANGGLWPRRALLGQRERRSTYFSVGAVTTIASSLPLSTVA